MVRAAVLPNLPAPGRYYDNGFISNFKPYEKPLVTWEPDLNRHLTYRTPEAYYASRKTTDASVREMIALANAPGEAKRAGRRVPLRGDWEQIKESAMFQALRWKFRPGTEAFDILMATDAYQLIEHTNWGDQYWGRSIATGEGQNRLGKMIMVFRQLGHEYIRNQQHQQGVPMTQSATASNESATEFKVHIAQVRSGVEGEYVGRSMPGHIGSPLGNPFKLEREADRDQVLEQYRRWLRERYTKGDRAVIGELDRLIGIARERGEITLLCWCAPKKCHAEVIQTAMVGLAREQKREQALQHEEPEEEEDLALGR